MKTICVFCGANAGFDPAYGAAIADLGQRLASQKIELVYGAGSVGLMGVLANSVLESGGRVTGIIPDFLKRMEVCHMGLDRLLVVETMHERKEQMARLSDGFLVFPGGFGTLDEFFEILTWRQLQLHQKPIALYNHRGYYHFLIQHLDKMVETGFLREENRALVMIGDHLPDLLDEMLAFQPKPAVSKWLDRT